MGISTTQLYVATFLALVAWIFALVAAADGPYQGWFAYKGILFGWKGESSHGYQAAYDSSVCFYNAMQAAIAFDIICLVFGAFVLISAILTTFRVGPSSAHFSKYIAFSALMAALSALISFAVAIGRVQDCSSVKLDIDYAPALLIVATVFYFIVLYLVYTSYH